jgi:predicted DNA-binding transcriptional regulator AlpA
MPDVLPIRPVGPDASAAGPRPEAPDHARLIDRDELARRLSVGVSTLDRHRAAGKVGPRVVRYGGSVRFLLAEVVAWLSTPASDGELHDAATWPAVWAAMQKKAGAAGR